MAQSLSYNPSNDQPILLSHRYPSTTSKLDYPSYQMDRPPLPPLSQLLTDSNTSDITNANELYYSTQPPSTILSSTDSSMASVDLFNTAATTNTTPTATPVTTETMVDPASCMLTTASQTMSTMYMNDPSSTVAATESLMYGPTMLPTTSSSPTTTSLSTSSPSSSILSTTTIDPLLSTANTASLDHPPTSMPYLYSAANAASYDRHRQDSVSSNSSDKVYSFVAIPGMNQRKRPRRRYDEIERLYHCTFPGCKKSYGTLNHLNSHVLMQSHGPKRHPSEFKEMRKEWRRIRKQREAQKKEVEQANKQQEHQLLQQQQQQQQHLHHPPMMTTTYQSPFMPNNSISSYPLQSLPMSGFY